MSPAGGVLSRRAGGHGGRSSVRTFHPNVYRLRMGDNYPGSPVINIQHLKRYYSNDTHQNWTTLPDSFTRKTESQEYKVEKIVGHKRVGKKAALWYLIRWAGYGRSYQCPPNSCRNPVIPAESGGIKFGRKACYFFSFRCLLFQQNLGIPELRPECSAEFAGTECNGIWLFVCLFHTCYQTNHQPNTMWCGLLSSPTTTTTTTTTTTMPPMTTNDRPATTSTPTDHHRRRLLTTTQKWWQTPQNEHERWPTQKRPPPPKNEPRPTTTTHHSPQTMASTHEQTQVMQTEDEGPGWRWGTRDNDNDNDYRRCHHFIFDTVSTPYLCHDPQLMQCHHCQPPTSLPLPNGKACQHISGHVTMQNETMPDDDDTDEWCTVMDNNEQWWPMTTWTTNIERPAAPPTNDEDRPAPPTCLHEHHHHPPAPTTNGKEVTPPPPTNSNEHPTIHQHPPQMAMSNHPQTEPPPSTNGNEGPKPPPPPPSNSTHHERHHHHQPMARRVDHHHQWTAMRACLFLPSRLPFNVYSN